MSKAERTRQFIIEQAAPIFNEKGIAGTSINDVLRAAKVAKGCLYGHFESKEALSHASVDYLLEKIADKRQACLQTQSTATGKLYAYMELNQYPLAPMVAGGCPMLNLATEADDTSPVIRQKVHNALAATTKLLTDILREGIRVGEFSDQLNPEEYALKMFAALEGGTMLCGVMRSNQPMQAIVKSLKTELKTYCRAVA